MAIVPMACLPNASWAMGHPHPEKMIDFRSSIKVDIKLLRSLNLLVSSDPRVLVLAVHVSLSVPVKRGRALLATNPIKE